MNHKRSIDAGTMIPYNKLFDIRVNRSIMNDYFSNAFIMHYDDNAIIKSAKFNKSFNYHIFGYEVHEYPKFT